MSSIQASYNTHPHSSTRTKRRHKPKPPRPQPPFRFRDLPLEIRNEIYQVFFVDHMKTVVEPMEGYEEDYWGDDEDPNNDTFVQLLLSRPYSKTTPPLNMLFMDNATHQEAVTVLNGFNEFQFQHRYPRRDLDVFLSELPESNRSHLRGLELNFPDLERGGLLVKSY